MKRYIAAITAALALAGLAGCGGTTQASEAACADALQDILRGDAPMAKPTACKGISEDRMGELSFHGSPEAADEAADEAAAAEQAGEDAERASTTGPADRPACLDAITTIAQLSDLVGDTQEHDRPVVCDGMGEAEYDGLYADAQTGAGS